MPGDNNIRVSARPRPLKALFSKYAPQAQNTSLPVRPLGVLRRPDSSQGSGKSNLPSDEELSDLERVCLYLEGGGMDGHKNPYLTSAKYLAEVLKSPQDAKYLPRLSKSQMFENQYKLAASRDFLKEGRPSSRSKAKRLITLPMYRVKVNNNNNTDLEDLEAVESTRKSLKNLMEVGKISASHPDNGLVTANIRNFQFVDLKKKIDNSSCHSSTRFKPHRFGESQCKEMTVMPTPASVMSDKVKNPLSLTVQSSESDQFLGGDTKASLGNKSLEDQAEATSQRESDLDKMEVRWESVIYTPTVGNKSTQSRGTRRHTSSSKRDMAMSFHEAHTLTSPATMATTSTLDYLNRVTPFAHSDPFSQNCRRSEPVSSESSSPLQVWPSIREIQKMKVEACRQALSARKQRRHKSKSTGSSTSGPEVNHVTVAKPSPRLRYTKQPRGPALDPLPIIVPSHTNIDCPMCKLHHHFPDSSSCPPNSPTIETSSCTKDSPVQPYCRDEIESHTVLSSDIGSEVIVIPTGQFINDDTSQRLSTTESLCSETPGETTEGH